MKRLGFWILAILWLPAGIIVCEIVRTGSLEEMLMPFPLVELFFVAPCGLPLALACLRLGRSDFRGVAFIAWVVLGAAVSAGLFGPLPIGIQALAAYLPVWWIVRRIERPPRRRLPIPPQPLLGAQRKTPRS